MFWGTNRNRRTCRLGAAFCNSSGQLAFEVSVGRQEQLEVVPSWREPPSSRVRENEGSPLI